ncbi:hypothetical protein CHK_2054 [Christensenella hongkongensis]|uniref:Uncharacterized protein n=1 Tax=Christensenella hongkongensis TaxID=270498 RepID=A0A0M2NJ45_9FIRM|nr:hypothetical protein CHK_2054 [Christensenella hongkongensis]
MVKSAMDVKEKAFGGKTAAKGFFIISVFVPIPQGESL